MVFPVKWIDWLGGSYLITLGGVTSLGPPTGVTGFAQYHRQRQAARSRRPGTDDFLSTIGGVERVFERPNLPIVLIEELIFL